MSTRLPSLFGLLVRRELKKIFTVKKFSFKNFDYLGALITLSTIAVLGACIIIVLKETMGLYFDVQFINSGVDSAVQRLDRQIELTTICYLVVFINTVIYGIININKCLAYNNDMENLLRLPISFKHMFGAKLVSLYLGSVMSSLFLLVPISITVALVSTQSLWYSVMSVLACVTMPIIALFVSALLSIPVKKIVNWIKNKYWLILVIFVAGLAMFFLLYTNFLEVIENYFVSGQIEVVFNEANVVLIGNISKYSYPVNIFVKLLFGRDVLPNAIFAILVTVAAVLGFILISRDVFYRTIVDGARKTYAYNKKPRFNKLSVTRSLVWREYINVMRTPSMTFAYFATALIMPLMVYCCTGLLSQLVFRMLGMSLNFEITLFVVLMFGVLTNTFCASNISREGGTFNFLKSLPISRKQLMLSKIGFCEIVNCVAIVSAVAVSFLSKYITVSEAVIVAVVTVLVTTGEMFLATKKDLARPQFAQRENNHITSFVIVTGIITTIIIGVMTMALSLLLPDVYQQSSSIITIISLFGVAIVYVALSATYLFVNINRCFDNLYE